MSTDHDITETDERAEALTEELAKKYDPERLLKLVSTRAGKGQSLEHSLRQKFEKRLGVDLGHVRVYTGEFAEEFNRQRQSYAVTVGGTGMILMGGSPDRAMDTRSGQALLGHELMHVAQQQRGLYNRSFNAVFAGELEEAAHDFESQLYAEGLDNIDTTQNTRTSANVAAAKIDRQEQVQRTEQQVRQRVLDMMADAYRTHVWRNSIQRRP